MFLKSARTPWSIYLILVSLGLVFPPRVFSSAPAGRKIVFSLRDFDEKSRNGSFERFFTQ